MKIAIATTLCFARAVSIVMTLLAVTAMVALAQTFTTLANFDGTNGSFPIANLIQGSDGNFYGTTFGNGIDVYGTVFQITPSGTLTTLYNFCSQTGCTDGKYPGGTLVEGNDGNFYGVTEGGGSTDRGTVFAITPAGALTTLYSFCAQACTDGSHPFGGLSLADDGNFYGTTNDGGTGGCGDGGGCGTVFKLAPTGQMIWVFSFSGNDGLNPESSLLQGTDGNLYGTTYEGGVNGFGTVFEITTGGTLTTLYNFCPQSGCADGSGPISALVEGTDGNFYGTTGSGGASSNCSGGCGTVFQITEAGTLTTLHSFDLSDGSEPVGLVQASDGNFYGAALLGGTSSNCSGGCGTVFELTPTGTLTTLHNFDLTGGAEPDGAIQARDGKFYGPTYSGGTSGNCGSGGCGTVFSLDVGLGNAGAVTLSRTSLPFAKQVINTTSAAKTITVTNSGTAPVKFNSVAASGDFAVSANTCAGTLAVGKKCKIRIVFTPTQLGPLTGTLTISDDAANSPQTVALSGTGVVPVTLTPESATYPKRTVGTASPAKTFTLTNSQNISLDNIAIGTNGDFAVSATTCTTSLPAKGKCKISVTFTPTAIGTRTGQLSVSNNASNSPQTASLTGTGK